MFLIHINILADSLLRRKHDLTRGLGLEKMRQYGKIKINIPNDCIRGVDDSGAWLFSYFGTLVRTYAHFYVQSWRDVPTKDHIWSHVLVSLYIPNFLRIF